MKIRNLVVVLGDQLDRLAGWRSSFDAAKDAVWMAEVAEESRTVWSHKQRIALFLSAMRHFAQDLRAADICVYYTKLEEADARSTLPSLLRAFLREKKVESVTLIRPGEWRLWESLGKVLKESGAEVNGLEDEHFYCHPDDFAEWAKGRKELRMEYFYRNMRRREGVLVDGDGKPEGGQWNYDADNRKSFPRTGPGALPEPSRFRPDAITREVLRLVEERFSGHPGRLDTFAWPVTPKQAKEALGDFIKRRLPTFGDFEDAMWQGEPFLYHSLLSTSLNLKLLNPRDVVSAADEAYREGHAPLPAVEGFIRQILGWREYVRGLYWLRMPDYLEENFLEAEAPLPAFYWNGKVSMNCLSETLGQTLTYGYAHHIQRLMVTGLYALLLGVRPREVHEWYLAIYADAVEWVELPNTLGMSQYADGGVMASKPYAATGKYIQRMSNYCAGCLYKPEEATGESACPFTTLYWDFLDRNQEKLRKNRRMSLQVRNLDRLSGERLREIRERAENIRGKDGEAAFSGISEDI